MVSADTSADASAEPSADTIIGRSLIAYLHGRRPGGARNWVLPGLITNPAAAAKSTSLSPYSDSESTAACMSLFEATGLTSSAYLLVEVSLLSQYLGMGAVTRMKIRGPRTDPCLTP